MHGRQSDLHNISSLIRRFIDCTCLIDNAWFYCNAVLQKRTVNPFLHMYTWILIKCDYEPTWAVRFTRIHSWQGSCMSQWIKFQWATTSICFYVPGRSYQKVLTALFHNTAMYRTDDFCVILGIVFCMWKWKWNFLRLFHGISMVVHLRIGPTSVLVFQRKEECNED